MINRRYTILDKLCLNIDLTLRGITGHSATTGRDYPAKKIQESSLSDQERKHAAALMRINHAGEVCAQALYHGQGLVSRNESVREKMRQSAIEEGDHLAWCRKRIVELGSHTSYLNPFWYMGSFTIGMAAGLIGDEWSLGFLAETETQVVNHLENQMQLLPSADKKSHVILQQMQKDEAHHKEDAVKAGGIDLPVPVKKVMRLISSVMVKLSYWV